MLLSGPAGLDRGLVLSPPSAPLPSPLRVFLFYSWRSNKKNKQEAVAAGTRGSSRQAARCSRSPPKYRRKRRRKMFLFSILLYLMSFSKFRFWNYRWLLFIFSKVEKRKRETNATTQHNKKNHTNKQASHEEERKKQQNVQASKVRTRRRTSNNHQLKSY